MTDADREGAARAAMAKANRARLVIEDELVVETLARMEQRWRDAWENSEYHDPEGREEAYRMLRTLKLFKDEFGQMLTDGKVARSFLDQLKALIQGDRNG